MNLLLLPSEQFPTDRLKMCAVDLKVAAKKLVLLPMNNDAIVCGFKVIQAHGKIHELGPGSQVTTFSATLVHSKLAGEPAGNRTRHPRH